MHNNERSENGHDVKNLTSTLGVFYFCVRWTMGIWKIEMEIELAVQTLTTSTNIVVLLNVGVTV